MQPKQLIAKYTAQKNGSHYHASVSIVLVCVIYLNNVIDPEYLYCLPLKLFAYIM